MSGAAPILFAICNANSGVTTLLSSGGVLRLFPGGVIPQDQSLPAAAYQTVGGSVLNSMDTPSRADNERIQIDAWSEISFDEAELVAAAIRSALEDTSAQASRGVGIRTLTPGGKGFEEATKRFRSTIEISFWTTN